MVGLMLDGGTYITIKEALMLAIFVGVYTLFVVLVGVVIAQKCRGETVERKRKDKLPKDPPGHDLKGDEPDYDLFRDAMEGAAEEPPGEDRRIPTMKGG
jgi:hypothetical protein